MYQPSPADEDAHWEMDYQLDLILSVVNAQRQLTLPLCFAEEKCRYCVQFNIDNIRFFLAGYVRRKDIDYKYVEYAKVRINRTGLVKNAKQLDISDDLKKKLMKI